MAGVKDRIIELLLSRGLVTKEQLDAALVEQREHGGALQTILTERGLVNESDLLSVVSQGVGIPPITLSRMKLDPTLRTLIPRDVALQYLIMPISCIGNTLTVAMADPMNVFALDTLTTLTGLAMNPLLSSPREIRESIDNYYGTGVEESIREMTEQLNADALQVIGESKEEEDAARLLTLIDEAPVVKYTDSILERAARMRASDLFIEPMEKAVRIRYRVDGVLQTGEAPPRSLHAAIVSRIKVMSELNIAERRLPQDGHFKFKLESRSIDYRVSILPSVFGEKVVLRVLDKTAVKLDLSQLGFSAADLERLKRCAARPHGMILVTGPTGSGKTTTLYAMLKLIDAPEKNIVTVEDPVEFELQGINQVNARPDIGLTFASALRSILRQDPDIIMVGEVRDSETADMAVKSALTGHLVLTTLHTNTASGAVVRLVNMGLEPFLINSCLMAVIGQRLVRKICSRCFETYQLPKGMAEKLGLLDQQGQPMPLARGKGCPACLQAGYAGREVIAEVLVMTPAIRALVLKRAPESQIEQVAQKEGMRRLRDHGLDKVMRHSTTLEEVLRTTTGEVVEE